MPIENTQIALLFLATIGVIALQRYHDAKVRLAKTIFALKLLYIIFLNLSLDHETKEIRKELEERIEKYEKARWRDLKKFAIESETYEQELTQKIFSFKLW